ncbi:UNVERIFIED_CONTAM: hypothetical protein Sangu_2800200 [Sesamum angustifolium]|uniref:Uncharacterized protein n=1 Tax=Sesamum angustifolium TaxID=2727405 RepID=A0AAW2IT30_9LAMI
MRHQKTLAISCGKVLKVKAQTMIFTQAQYDEDDRKVLHYLTISAAVVIATMGTTHLTEGKFDKAEDSLRIGPINGKFLKRYYA